MVLFELGFETHSWSARTKIRNCIGI